MSFNFDLGIAGRILRQDLNRDHRRTRHRSHDSHDTIKREREVIDLVSDSDDVDVVSTATMTKSQPVLPDLVVNDI